jgi:ankyrin repeat protein
MLAACSGDTGITQALLNRGADPRKICWPGKTAMVVAIERGYNGIVDLLKRAAPISANEVGKSSVRHRFHHSVRSEIDSYST